MADLTNINALFATRKNQFDKTIYQRNWRTNPYMGLMPMAQFDESDGRVPEVITNTYEVTTDFPTPSTMTALSVSSGTGNSCDTTETVIKTGYTSRTYQLYKRAFETDVICLSDFKFEYEIQQQVANKERALQEFSTDWWTKWFQAQMIGMIDVKLSTTSATGFTEVSNSNYTFSGLTLPTQEFSWDHANAIYDRLIRLGAAEYRVGDAGGQPVFSWNGGPGYKRKLWQVDAGVRDTVNWLSAGKDYSENFIARGINKAVYGFIPNVDNYPVRYDGSLVYIPPFINTDATVGRKSIPNPAYKSVALGGNAQYEVITISCRQVFQPRVRPVDPTSAGMQSFSAQNYSGEARWINNPNMSDNKRGDKGFYLLDIQVAAKPIYPELGFAILTVAKD